MKFTQTKRRHRGVDPSYLLERSFLQWNIIDSIANAVIGWFLICVYLFWHDPMVEAWSISGVTFIIVGLIAYADIFGVFLYLTNKGIMMYMKERHPPFPDIKYLKKLCWISNIVWFVIMFVISKLSFDLMYQTIHSLFKAL